MRAPSVSRHTRRAFLQQFSGLSVAGPALAGLGLNLAALGTASAGSGGYKALVCVYLYGGNDAYNTVLPTEDSAWSAYAAARGPLALARPGVPALSGGSFNAGLGGALPVSGGLAFHPCMGEMASLHAAGRLAVLANVGPLMGPLSKSSYARADVAKPPKLFSHNDQQSIWQALAPEGATQGWGGRMADLLLGGNQQAMFTALSASGNAVWLAGQQARPFQLAPSGTVRVGGDADNLFGSPSARQQALSLMASAREDSVLQRDYAAMVGRSAGAQALLAGSLPAVAAGPWSSAGLAPQDDPLLRYTDPEARQPQLNPLAQQLQIVARMIAARDNLGMQRQVFFVSLDGFDTHTNQGLRHARGLARLSHGLGYFDTVLRALGVDQQVTTFTASDFGRNFASNGDGSDHGWGGHHFITGGAVRGGRLYGRFPTYGRVDGLGGFNSPDQLTGGALLPAIPVDGYAATLGRWLGLSDSQLLDVLPRLARFDASVRQLGFMA